MAGKSIDDLIDAMVEEGLFVGPDAITEEVLLRVAQGEIDVTFELRKLLRVYVSVRLSQRRNRPHRLPPIEAVASRQPASAKVLAIRTSLAPAWLEEQVAVGRKDWKKLGDCTVIELEDLARRRLEQAENHRAKAHMYFRWVEHMRERGTQRLRDLPSSILNGDVQ